MEVVIFTSSYPFGTGETFLELELEVWLKKGFSVILVPLNCQETPRSSFNRFDKSVYVLRLKGSFSKGVFNWYQRFLILLSEGILNEMNLTSLRYNLRLLRNAEGRAFHLREELLRHSNSKKIWYYSYWMDEWATSLSILVQNGVIEKFVSRVHGFDLYEERRADGKIPFRKFQMENVSTIYSVSLKGVRYLNERYSDYSNKFEVSYLGTKDMGMGPVPSEDDKFHIVSCSTIKPLKRVSRILKVVLQMKKVKWTHIGDGPDLEKYRELSKLRSEVNDVEIDFKGPLEYEDVMRFYSREAIHCFLNVSETEGVPVSIIEAMSFGIPVIATDVGGTTEAIGNSYNIILSKDFDDKALELALVDIVDSACDLERRSLIRQVWFEKFEMNHNFDRFIRNMTEES